MVPNYQHSDIEKHIAKHLHYFGIQQRLLDAHKTKVESITFRKHIIEKRKMANYENEYDRVRAILAKSVVGRTGSPSIEHIKQREKELTKMGASTNFNII
jgi:hypothetical protein